MIISQQIILTRYTETMSERQLEIRTKTNPSEKKAWNLGKGFQGTKEQMDSWLGNEWALKTAEKLPRPRTEYAINWAKSPEKKAEIPENTEKESSQFRMWEDLFWPTTARKVEVERMKEKHFAGRNYTHSNDFHLLCDLRKKQDHQLRNRRQRSEES